MTSKARSGGRPPALATQDARYAIVDHPTTRAELGSLADHAGDTVIGGCHHLRADLNSLANAGHGSLLELFGHHRLRRGQAWLGDDDEPGLSCVWQCICLISFVDKAQRNGVGGGGA